MAKLERIGTGPGAAESLDTGAAEDHANLPRRTGTATADCRGASRATEGGCVVLPDKAEALLTRRLAGDVPRLGAIVLASTEGRRRRHRRSRARRAGGAVRNCLLGLLFVSLVFGGDIFTAESQRHEGDEPTGETTEHAPARPNVTKRADNCIELRSLHSDPPLSRCNLRLERGWQPLPYVT